MTWYDIFNEGQGESSGGGNDWERSEVSSRHFMHSASPPLHAMNSGVHCALQMHDMCRALYSIVRGADICSMRYYFRSFRERYII
jgi:hypothetical protein